MSADTTPRSAALPPPEQLTPMFRQWLDAKRSHPDALLFFRMGDFYELFYEDAERAAPVLEIALTARGKGTATEAPMCGVPHHAVDAYLARLVERGFRVAICEQVEDPRKVKGMVRREVVRVVSPGTYTAAEPADPGASQNLAAVVRVSVVAAGDEAGWGVALCDLGTGGLLLARAARDAELLDLFARYDVREVVCREPDGAALTALVAAFPGARPLVTPRRDELVAAGSARERLCEALGVASLGGFGCPDDHPALPAALAALRYLADTQRVRPAHLDRLRVLDPRRTLVLDEATRRNLELVGNLRDGSRRHTLLEVLDRTRTPLGARLLRAWLQEPLAERAPLAERLGLVDDFFQRADRRRAARDALSRVRDLERLLARAVLGSATPADLLAVRRSLEAVPEVRAALGGPDALPGAAAGRLRAALDPLDDLVAEIAARLAEEPAGAVGEGRVLRAGCDAELDEARDLARGGRTSIAEIEARERERTGIATLKVRYNRVFGYYIEVSKANVARVPAHWERRQTVATGERYVTAEVRELETRILAAEERMRERETALYDALVGEVAARAARIRGTAAALAEIDAAAGLAEAAAQEGYVRPRFAPEGGDGADDDALEIEDGRHPVVERLIPAGRFVPNDCRLDATRRILVVTGPNMGGKSTYLRQVALITLMAHAGSFVPARTARIPLTDRVFCRVGASDNLAGGESTFMVEMTETANILHNATPRSLVVLDEIGRGTATWDGMAIAWAVVEALHDDPRLAPKALFATHYHELTELARTLPRLANAHIAVREHGHDVVFLHRVEPGPSDRSYGIHVARLAGLPDRVVARARAILERLAVEHAPAARGVGRPGADTDAVQLDLFGAPPDPRVEDAVARLRAADPDGLSPREAHDLLRALRTLLDS